MARIFVDKTGTIAVWGDWLNDQPMPEGWTQIAEYDEGSYQATHDTLSRESANATWNTATQKLTVKGEVVIDSTWIANAEAELQAMRDQQQALDTLRTANTTQLELSDFTGERAAVQALVQKIIWLEAEVRQLRQE